jgi:hypothetical protein
MRVAQRGAAALQRGFVRRAGGLAVAGGGAGGTQVGQGGQRVGIMRGAGLPEMVERALQKKPRAGGVAGAVGGVSQGAERGGACFWRGAWFQDDTSRRKARGSAPGPR